MGIFQSSDYDGQAIMFLMYERTRIISIVLKDVIAYLICPQIFVYSCIGWYLHGLFGKLKLFTTATMTSKKCLHTLPICIFCDI